MVDAAHFAGMKFIDVHPDEAHGANRLLLGQAVIYPDSFPLTRQRLGLPASPLTGWRFRSAEGEGAVTAAA